MTGTPRRGILVTGPPRGGTTWVGKMLALDPSTGYIHEPFNPVTPAGISPAPFSRFLEYVTPATEAAYAPYLEQTLAFRYALGAELGDIRSLRDGGRAARDLTRTLRYRIGGRRPLVKDPIAVLSTEWLARRFDLAVIVTVRNPGAVAASFKRLGWSHRFHSFLEQPELMREHLAPFERRIVEYAKNPPELVSQAVLLWNIIHHVLRELRERHPEWTFVRHEDLAADPLGGFARLYEAAGLSLTPRIKRQIERHTSGENPAELSRSHSVRLDSRASLATWRRHLDEREIEHVRAETRPVASAFYAEDEW